MSVSSVNSALQRAREGNTRPAKPLNPLQRVNALARELRALGYQVTVAEGRGKYTSLVELHVAPKEERR